MTPIHDQDDRALLETFRASRSEAAFTELVRRHLPLVMQVARRRLPSRAVAEEAAQITFSLLANKIATVAGHPERLMAWLCRTAYLTAKGLARKEARLTKIPLPPPEPPAPMAPTDLHDRLDAALNRLPELDRELVLRHCCAGEGYREIASAVGKSAAACQKRVERALAVLGRSVGGARTAEIALATMAATTAKSDAMPSAAQIASLALQQKSSASAAALGGTTGLHLAACAALALAGGVAGWEPREASPAPEVVRSTSPRAGADRVTARGTLETVALSPRPDPIYRSLPELLESIQAQRLGPLIEFLPRANVADLRAIIAEDDIASHGEGSGRYRAAHTLAVQRWTEIDPAGAFAYGKVRDIEGGFHGVGAVTRMVFQTWMQTDPKAALASYRALSRKDRGILGGSLAALDPDTAGRLAAMDPEIAWDIAEARSKQDDHVELQHPTADEATEWIAHFLGNKNPDTASSNSVAWLEKAFETLAAQDTATALAQADLLPPGNLRDSMRVVIYRKHPPQAARLAPGQMRAFALAHEAGKLATADPDAALRRLRSAPPADRGIIAAALARTLAASDPWRLLEHAAAEPALFGKHAEQVLAITARSDPHRALSLVRKMVSGMAVDPRPYLKQVAAGWLEIDASAALRWAMFEDMNFNDHKDLEILKSASDLQPIIDLLDHPKRSLHSLAFNTLYDCLKDGLGIEGPQGLLARIPQHHADQMLGVLATQTFGQGHFDRGMKIAGMASQATPQRVLLRDMTLMAREVPAAIEWLKARPAADRQHLAADLEQWLTENPEANGRDQVRGIIQHIIP